MIIKTIQLNEDRPSVNLKTYILDDSSEMLNGQKRPGILICPGGGYLGCSDREAEPIAMRFAAMGYHAFVLRYSTYFEKFGGFGEGGLPPQLETAHPAPVRDIGKAFLILHEHADEWLLDMDKIAICGFSAGGHNCAMYAAYWDKPLIIDHFGKPAEMFKPAASIIGYALTDYFLALQPPANPMLARIRRASAIAFLGTADPDDILLTEVSPARQATESMPPTFIWGTVDDDLVPAAHSTRMANVLADAGIPFEIHLFERGKHGLGLADQATAGSRLDIEIDAAQWIELAGRWLEKRFALPLPEQPAWMVAMEKQRASQK